MSILKLGRAIAVVAAIVAAPGILELAGPPMWAALRGVAFNLAANRSETENLRQKMSGALRRARMANPQVAGLLSAVHPNAAIGIVRPAWRAEPYAGHPTLRL